MCKKFFLIFFFAFFLFFMYVSDVLFFFIQMFLSSFISLFFPRHCVLCSEVWSYLCPSCKKTLKPALELCPVCHRFSPDYAVCLSCKTKMPYLDWIIVPFIYTDALRTLLRKLRWWHRKDVALFLAQRLHLAILSHWLLWRQEHIYVTHVPSHRWKTYMEKWYNPSSLLAHFLSKEGGFNHQHLFKKTKYTSPQTSLSPQQRLTHLSWTILLKDHIPFSWKETILLVDDVVWTWATLHELAKLLKSRYPKLSLWGVVCAQTLR